MANQSTTNKTTSQKQTVVKRKGCGCGKKKGVKTAG